MPRLYEQNSRYHPLRDIAGVLSGALMNLKTAPAGADTSSWEPGYDIVSCLVRNEMPTYHVSPNLLAAAVATSIPPTIRLEDVNWPMPAMVFVLPRGGLTLDDGSEFRFIAYSRMPVGEGNSPVAGFPPSCDQDYDGFGIFSSTTRDLVSTSLMAMQNVSLSDFADMALPEGRSTLVPADSVNFGKTARQVALKLLLILSARSNLVHKGSVKRGSSEKKGRTKSELWSPNILGLDYQQRVETDANCTRGEGTAKRLHWVRGHLRQQPYGPRENPRHELIWIEPFLSGRA
jgi:hypothetical protein